MHEYTNVIYRLRQGQLVRAIARETAVGRHKIKQIKETALQKGWLNANVPLPDESVLKDTLSGKTVIKTTTSKADPYAKQIEEWITQGIQASTIHQHLILNFGFEGSYNSIQRYVQKLKTSMPPELTVPLQFQPGQAAQIDFGQGPVLFDERVGCEVKTWFFVMTLCWSRHQYVELITHQDVETWLGCHQRAFEWFDGVPGKLIIDNAKCAITKACYHDPQVQRSYENFAMEYQVIISACAPRDPKKKGRVESGVKYVKRNFLPLRELKSLQQANNELKQWVLGIAGNRKHGSTFEKPLNQFSDVEVHHLKALPVARPEISFWQKVKLYKDCHVRFKKANYSAPYRLYGKELWLKATPTMIAIYCNHERVALHSRAFKAGEWRTKDDHLPPNARSFLAHDEQWCLTKSQEIGESCHFVIESLLTDPVRDLLRQSQSILKLEKTYTGTRLERACQRAITFNTINYQTIKTILKEGLDYEQLTSNDAFDHLGTVYQGQAQFQRNYSKFSH